MDFHLELQLQVVELLPQQAVICSLLLFPRLRCFILRELRHRCEQPCLKTMSVALNHHDLATAKQLQKVWSFSVTEARWRQCDFLRAVLTKRDGGDGLDLLRWLHKKFHFMQADLLRFHGNLLHLACCTGGLQRLLWIHETYQLTPAHWNTRRGQCFLWAMRWGQLDICQWLKEQLQLPRDFVRTAAPTSPLEAACHNGTLPVLKWLADNFELEKEMLFSDNRKCLRLLGRKASTVVVTWAVQHFGLTADERNCPELVHPAIKHGNYALLRWLK